MHQRSLLLFDTDCQMSLSYRGLDCSLVTMKIQGEIAVLKQCAGLLSSLEAVTQVKHCSTKQNI